MALFRAEFKGRDLIEINVAEASLPPQIKVIGCAALLLLVRRYQIQFTKDVRLWPIPKGDGHEELLLREVLMRMKGQWKFPYAHEELCHCRSVSTEKVDQAILAGARSGEVVSRKTGASTACGTCRPEVLKIIDYRYPKSS